MTTEQLNELARKLASYETDERHEAIIDLVGAFATLIRQEGASAAKEALDKIATISGCEQWDYPGQVVRDVAALRDKLDDREEFEVKLGAHIEECPAGWVGNRIIRLRETTDELMLQWFQRLWELRQELGGTRC